MSQVLACSTRISPVTDPTPDLVLFPPEIAATISRVVVKALSGVLVAILMWMQVRVMWDIIAPFFN